MPEILKKVPNIITILRILLSPIFIVLFGKAILNSDLSLMVIFYVLILFMSLTDILDGYLARKYKIVSNFGKIYDPLADKILIFSSFGLIYYVCGLIIVIMPLTWGHGLKIKILLILLFCLLIFISILRDVIITMLRFLAKKKGLLVDADKYGKLKTIFQFITIHSFFLAIIFSSLDIHSESNYDIIVNSLYLISFFSAIISFYYSMISAFNYVKQYREEVK